MVAAAPMYRMAAVARFVAAWATSCWATHDREFVCRWFPERVLPPPPLPIVRQIRADRLVFLWLIY